MLDCVPFFRVHKISYKISYVNILISRKVKYSKFLLIKGAALFIIFPLKTSKHAKKKKKKKKRKKKNCKIHNICPYGSKHQRSLGFFFFFFFLALLFILILSSLLLFFPIEWLWPMRGFEL